MRIFIGWAVATMLLNALVGVLYLADLVSLSRTPSNTAMEIVASVIFGIVGVHLLTKDGK